MGEHTGRSGSRVQVGRQGEEDGGGVGGGWSWALGAAAKLARRLREDGVGATAAWVREGLSEAYVERQLGIHSVASADDENLSARDDRLHLYTATKLRDFKRLLKHVPIRRNEDVFLDFGSGKGRVVIMAALHPFRRVIGVELSADLAATAAQNLERARSRLRCKDVELVTADASAYEIPADVTVIYLYSPFQREVLRKVFDNIEASLERSPRSLTIIYKNCVYLERDVGPLPGLRQTAAFEVGGHPCVILRSGD